MAGRKRKSLQLALLAAGTLLSQASVVDPQSLPSHDLIFSHRMHLGRHGTVCADCHGSVASSTTAEDRNTPAERTCVRCHDGARAANECTLCHRNPERAASRPASRRTFRFNHQLHLALGDVAPALASAIDAGRYLSPPGDTRRRLSTGNPCLACHRGIEETDLADAARLPRMADCLVCHTRIDPPFSCGYCHTKEQQLKPANHTPGFADMHSSRKAVPDKTSCKVCHGVKFTCMGCH